MDRENFISSESNISPGGLLVRKHYCLGMRRLGKRDYGSYVIPQFDGGTTESGKNYKKNVWDSIFKVLRDNEIDVEGYVEFVFTTNKSISSPNVLKIPSILDKYKRELLGEIKPTIWEFEDNKILTEITFHSYVIKDPIKVLEYVLLDDTIHVSPLSRYSFGLDNGMEFIVKPIEDEAFKQYYSKRYFYERHYKKRIPDNLRKKAQEFDERVK